MTLATLTQDASQLSSFFGDHWGGWPALYFVVTVGFAVYVARWAMPLLTDLTRALIAFVGALDSRIKSLEAESKRANEALERIERLLEQQVHANDSDASGRAP